MKHLQDYIYEKSEEALNENATSKSIKFDFKDLENAKETLDSLQGKEGVTIEDESLTVEITSDNADKLGTVQDILQQYCQSIRSSQKRSSDESYAQKTVKFENTLNEFNDALDEIQNPEESEEKDDDKNDNKDDKK